MTIRILEAAAIHEAVFVLRAGIGHAARSLGVADDIVDLVPAIGGQAEQRLVRGLCISDRLRREMTEFVVGRQHHENGLGKDHAARGVVAELRIPGRADRLVKGGRTLEVGHRQIEENHPGHRKLLGRGSAQGRTAEPPSDTAAELFF
jgi:hypothetical protein